MFHISGAPKEADAYFRDPIYITFGVFSKGNLPQVPFHVPSQTDVPFLEPSFIHPSKSPVYEPQTPDSRCHSVVKWLLWREMTVSEDFPNISFRVPSEGAPSFPEDTPTPRVLFRPPWFNLSRLSTKRTLLCSRLEQLIFKTNLSPALNHYQTIR